MVNRRTSRRLHIYRGLCAGTSMDMLMRMVVNMRAWRRWKRAVLDGIRCGRLA